MILFNESSWHRMSMAKKAACILIHTRIIRSVASVNHLLLARIKFSFYDTGCRISRLKYYHVLRIISFIEESASVCLVTSPDFGSCIRQKRCGAV